MTLEGEELILSRTFMAAYVVTSLIPASFTLVVGMFFGGALHSGDHWFLSLFGLGLVSSLSAARDLASVACRSQVSRDGRHDAVAVRVLTIRGALKTGALVMAFLGGHHVLSHFDTGQPPALQLVSPGLAILVYSGLMATFHYFMAGALWASVHLRTPLSVTDFAVPPTGLARRLTTTVLITGLVPLALAIVLVGHEVMALSPRNHALHFQMFLVLDLVAAVLILFAAVVFFTLTVERPVVALVDCMDRLREGDLGVRAMVTTDDELGKLAVGFNTMAEELEQQHFLQESLGRFVPEPVAAAVRADHGVVRPCSAVATILYSDIEGFSRLCQCRSPSQIFSMLTDYFHALSECVEAHGGVITQFQGDAVLATFNLPLPDEEHALNAVKAAVEIQKRVAGGKFGNGAQLPTRIGVTTGPVVAGTVSGGIRLGYTVHGDSVNLAQRLEDANKRTGTRLLFSRETAELVKFHYEVVALGSVRLPGREGLVEVFTTTGQVDDVCGAVAGDCVLEEASSFDLESGEELVGCADRTNERTPGEAAPVLRSGEILASAGPVPMTRNQWLPADAVTTTSLTPARRRF